MGSFAVWLPRWSTEELSPPENQVLASLGIGILGGGIYDSILGHCALKAGAETLYTWNTKDFLRLPAAIASRVKAPDQAGI